MIKGDHVGFPKAQTDQVVTRWVDDELVVVDEVTSRAHCLDAQAARVFEACTGLASMQDIADALDLPLDTVERACDELSDAGLVTSVGGQSITRRNALRLSGVAVAALAVPMVYSTVIRPAAAHATQIACHTQACSGTTGQGGAATSAKAKTKAKAKADKQCQSVAACGPSAACSGTYSVVHSSVYIAHYQGHCLSAGATP